MVTTNDCLDPPTLPSVIHPQVNVHISCGMKQLYLFMSTPNPEQEMIHLFKSIERMTPKDSHAARCGMYIFSDKYDYWQREYDRTTGEYKNLTKIETAKYGKQFADYIVQQGLGIITESPEAINPNTGHRIRCWIWNVDHAALTKWCADHGIQNRNDLPITEGAKQGFHT